MKDRIKVGIIGAGAIARDIHIPNYLKQGKKVEITAVADIVKEHGEALAEAYDIEKVYKDFNDMLDEVDLDAVSVCTPNKFHAAATIAALEAGCHVLCEKPPSMNAIEAKQMAEAAKKAGKMLLYGLCYRYAPEVTALKRFIDADELGHIYAARVHANRRRGIPGWGVFTNKELQGGGPLIDIGVHMLDVALYLMDYPTPQTIFGVTYQELGVKKGVGTFGNWDWENFSVEDMARGMMTFDNGASLILETSFAANIEKHEELSVALMGDKGGADVFPLKIFQEKHETLVDTTTSYIPPGDKYELQIRHFVDNCLKDNTLESNMSDGVKLQTIINGLYESAEKGTPIHLN